ncbi:MAG: peptidylprolyl isomerase [Candidatus Electryonea clarkiae]|nr:peptidylprolyl isomerase [Candidatus Electryonea clarkiae]MDP8288819.1 peptidylprolyl isomerase [Candidatus Electryonea clarkiae]
MKKDNLIIGVLKHWFDQKLLLLLILTFVVGCNIEEEKGSVIARVGNNNLSAEDVTRSLDEMQLDPSDPMLRAKFINNWVDRKLLLHEAKRRGLEHNKQLVKRIESIREQMIVSLLLETVIEDKLPDEEEIIAYWQTHSGEFIRLTDEVRVVLAIAPDKNTAWGIRNSMDRSRTGKDILGMYENVSLDTIGWINPARLPKKVSYNLKRLRTNDPSLPFQLEEKWAVVKLLQKERGGETRPLDEVSDIIFSWVKAEQKERSEIDFVTDLRRRARREGIVQLFVAADPSIDLILNGNEEEQSEKADSLSIQN